MKATGIIRPIDDLGRIVIPQEIRRTLRIREGDPFEILLFEDGGILLKKKSRVEGLGDFVKEYAESLFEVTGCIALVTDRDCVVAVSGANKREFLGIRNGKVIEEAMQKKATLITDQEIIEGLKTENQLIVPIISHHTSVGTVIIATKNDEQTITNVEIKLADTAASFLGKQIG